MHAIDVGPDLNFLGIQHRTDNRGCVVAAATFQIVNIAESIAAYISLSDINIGIRVHIHQSAKASGYILHVGLAVAVRTHIIQCRDQDGVYAAFVQVEVHHTGRDQFALCQDNFFFEQREKIFRKRADMIEMMFYQFFGFLFIFVGVVEFFNMAVIFLCQFIDDFVCSVRVFLLQVIRDFNQ